MNNDEHKQKVMASFDMASEGYDCPSLRFFAESASHLISLMQLKGTESLLDVATGTGHVALTAAQALENGNATGIDLSEKMLQRAVNKANEMNLRNVTFKQCDVEDMGFEDNAFDAASCAFGLFFLPDMENGLKCISRVLKPGGKLAITSFAPSLMMPLRRMLLDGIKRYGVEEPKLSWMLLDNPEKIYKLLSGAGYRDIRIHSRQMGCFLKNSLEWRDVLWNSGYRGLLSRLPGEDLERFMDEHLKEADGLADENGIWLEVEVLFATGRNFFSERNEEIYSLIENGAKPAHVAKMFHLSSTRLMSIYFRMKKRKEEDAAVAPFSPFKELLSDRLRNALKKHFGDEGIFYDPQRVAEHLRKGHGISSVGEKLKNELGSALQKLGFMKQDEGIFERKINTPPGKSKRWVACLHESIAQLDENLKAAIMRPAGEDCASDILGLCEDHLGREVVSIEDLVEGWNMVRNKRRLSGEWKIEGNILGGVFGECGCSLVRSGLVKVHPVQCYCSQSMMETIFSRVSGKPAEVKIERSIGRGDDVCEFVIKLDR